jgi:hypothetical protein
MNIQHQLKHTLRLAPLALYPVLICIALVGFLALGGCMATLAVNPKTGEVKYTRLGRQEIGGLDVQKEGDKIIVKIDSLKNSSTQETDLAVRALLRALGNVEAGG